MSIIGERDAIDSNDFLAVAKAMNIKKGPKLIQEVNAVVEQWQGFADEARVNKAFKSTILKTLIHL